MLTKYGRSGGNGSSGGGSGGASLGGAGLMLGGSGEGRTGGEGRGARQVGYRGGSEIYLIRYN